MGRKGVQQVRVYEAVAPQPIYEGGQSPGPPRC